MAELVKVEGLDHYAITVSNLEETIKWYSDKLGFTLVKQFENADNGMKISHMQAPDYLLEIFEPKNPIPLPEYRLHPDTDLSAQGQKHMSVGVINGPQAVRDLEALGVKVVAIKEVANTYGAFIQDNTGNLIEVFEIGDSSECSSAYQVNSPASPENSPTAPGSDPIKVEGINHIGISVANLDITVDWYNRIFGFTELHRDEIPGIGAKVCHMQAKGFVLEIFQFPGSAPISDERHSFSEDTLTCGNKHFSLGISDIKTAIAQLEGAGIPIAAVRELHGKQNIFINDIAGNVIELSEI